MNKSNFINYYQKFPWKTNTAFKGFHSKSVNDYHVFATPTYVLLYKI